jgi:cell division protein FtsN
MLAVLGCLGVLGLVFGLGFYTGRYVTRAATVVPGPAGTTPARGTPVTAAPPTLTFYQELTAPLNAPPPPAPRAETAERAGAAAKVERAALAPPRPKPREEPGGRVERTGDIAERRPAAGDGRFTVQVGAYSGRAQAEALRSSIASAGHEVSIVEAEVPPGGPRFRVRVGSFSTREAAAAAAARLAAEGQRATYVTTR